MLPSGDDAPLRMKNTGVGYDGYASVESRADLGLGESIPRRLIVDGARVVGGLARAYLSTRSNSMPRATVSAASSAVIANAVRARILPRGCVAPV